MKFAEYMGVLSKMRYTKIVSDWESLDIGISFVIVSLANLNDNII